MNIVRLKFIIFPFFPVAASTISANRESCDCLAIGKYHECCSACANFSSPTTIATGKWFISIVFAFNEEKKRATNNYSTEFISSHSISIANTTSHPTTAAATTGMHSWESFKILFFATDVNVIFNYIFQISECTTLRICILRQKSQKLVIELSPDFRVVIFPLKCLLEK